jgi:serine/threonine-protein kinase
VVAFASVAPPLEAQCPDGTPPPCGAQRHARESASASVAVLYFDNLSRDTTDAYLSDGLTEEIIVRLGQISRLDVKSHYLTRLYRGRVLVEPASLGRALGVGFLLTGSIRRDGSRLRVTVELVRAASGAHVWGDTFDRTSDNLLSLPAEIARAVARRITGRLQPQDRAVLARRITVDQAAYDYYLRGNYMFSRFTEPDLRAAIASYRRALSRDSSFALAHSRIAWAWNFLADDYVPPREAYPQARYAAERALAAESSASSLAALVFPTLTLDHDLAAAERMARRAYELNPDLAEASWGMMGVRWAQGRMTDAVAYSRRAWELDTLSSTAAIFHAATLASARRFEDLAAFLPHLRSALPEDETDGMEGLVRLGHGDCVGAVPLLRQSRKNEVRISLVPALVCAGQDTVARTILDSLLAERQRRYLPASILGVAYEALGDLERAFEWLQRAYDESDAVLLLLSAGPYFDGLRRDERFQTLVARAFATPDRRP